MNKELLTKTVAPHINITPLIDVLLVLLIIFMVVSPLKPARFQAAISSEPKDGGEPNPLTLIVTVNQNSSLSLNKQNDFGTVNDAGKLSVELARVFGERQKNSVFDPNLEMRSDLSDSEKTLKTVFIKAPRRIAYGDVIKVMDAVKGAGANPVGLQIDDLSD